MLTYTNHLKKLILPEYGRNIQNMVDHCLTIEDRDQRTLCANSIIDAMMTLFPPTGDRTEYMRKLWDHLVIMSDFRLDVDFPFEHVDREVFADKPDPVPTVRPSTFPYRHYGQLTAALIEAAVAMPEGEERDALVVLIANQMKKTIMASNHEGVDDARIFKDLRMMSHGAINIDPEQLHLHDYKQAPTPSGKRKKKR